jgi:hypothetical protein
MRARLGPGIPIIGLTASLLADLKVQNSIFALLGVNRGEFETDYQQYVGLQKLTAKSPIVSRRGRGIAAGCPGKIRLSTCLKVLLSLFLRH